MKELLSIPALVREVKNIDPESAINIGMINCLIEQKYLSCVVIRTQKRLNFDRFTCELKEMLGLSGDTFFPSIRTISDAWETQRESGIGFSKLFLHDCVANKIINSIAVGNRRYIALDFFDEPYIGRFSDPTLHSKLSSTSVENKTDTFNFADVNQMPTFRRSKQSA